MATQNVKENVIRKINRFHHYATKFEEVVFIFRFL